MIALLFPASYSDLKPIPTGRLIKMRKRHDAILRRPLTIDPMAARSRAAIRKIETALAVRGVDQ